MTSSGAAPDSLGDPGYRGVRGRRRQTTPAPLHPRADEVLQILARQPETGKHISEAEIGQELGLNATEVAGILRGLTTTEQVMRTESGNWELTPAAQRSVKPRPHPKEPPAG
jgi:hypothetical protein